ncbi:MAG: hypothetical protein ACLR78_01055 [Roseburia sp.]
MRKYVSDNSCVDKIIELYEKKEEGTPLFVFNVTMQNHGGYSDTYDNFTPDITVEGVESTPLSRVFIACQTFGSGTGKTDFLF